MGKGLRREPQVEFPIPHGRQVRPRDPFERHNMIPISCALRSKPNWTEKVFDESILTNWKEEVARALAEGRHGKGRLPPRIKRNSGRLGSSVIVLFREAILQCKCRGKLFSSRLTS